MIGVCALLALTNFCVAAQFTGVRCAVLHGSRDSKRAAIASVKGTRCDMLLTSYETFETL